MKAKKSTVVFAQDATVTALSRVDKELDVIPACHEKQAHIRLNVYTVLHCPHCTTSTPYYISSEDLPLKMSAV